MIFTRTRSALQLSTAIEWVLVQKWASNDPLLVLDWGWGLQIFRCETNTVILSRSDLTSTSLTFGQAHYASYFYEHSPSAHCWCKYLPAIVQEISIVLIFTFVVSSSNNPFIVCLCSSCEGLMVYFKSFSIIWYVNFEQRSWLCALFQLSKQLLQWCKAEKDMKYFLFPPYLLIEDYPLINKINSF